MAVHDLLLNLAIQYGFQVLGALLILGAGLIVGRWLGRMLDGRLQRQGMEPPLRALIVRGVKLLVLLFALVMALDRFGFQIAPLVAGIGVAGLGIGFALQGVLGNLMAGLTIIFTKPFRVGEYIDLLGEQGEVLSIELFTTTLLHADRSRVVIPNRKIVGEILHNFGTMRQLDLAVPLPHAADLRAAVALAREIVAANPRVLKDPPAVIGVTEIGEVGLRLSVKPWVAVPDFVAAGGELNQTLVERFRSAGVPAPARQIRLVDGAAAAGASVR
jgi:small conductance mechanosensitive channel